MLIYMILRIFGKLMFLQGFTFGEDMYIVNNNITYEVVPSRNILRNNCMKEYSERYIRSIGLV